MGFREEDLNDRVLSYVYAGQYDMIQTLFEIGFLRPDDTFDITGRGYRGNPEDLEPLLIHIARASCPEFKKIIDILLLYGADLSDAVDTALSYKNYAVAAHLINKGAAYETFITDDIRNAIDNSS